MDVLPMFPLGTVLVPGGVLALHVFEHRYRRLVRDCLAMAEPEFGVTLIARGSEVGGGDERTDVGTVARIVQVAQTEDGRFAVIGLGVRRIRVESWLDDAPYPRAEVADWPDDPIGLDGEWEATVSRVARRLRTVLGLAVELGDIPGAALDDELAAAVAEPSDLSVTSHRLCGAAPLGPADRQLLLGSPDPLARLVALEGLLETAESVLLFRLGGDDTTAWGDTD